MIKIGTINSRRDATVHREHDQLPGESECAPLSSPGLYLTILGQGLALVDAVRVADIDPIRLCPRCFTEAEREDVGG